MAIEIEYGRRRQRSAIDTCFAVLLGLLMLGLVGTVVAIPWIAASAQERRRERSEQLIAECIDRDGAVTLNARGHFKSCTYSAGEQP